MNGNTKSIIAIIISILIIGGFYWLDHKPSNNPNEIVNGSWAGINSDGRNIKLQMTDGKFVASYDIFPYSTPGTYAFDGNVYHDNSKDIDFYILTIRDTNSNSSSAKVWFKGDNIMYWLNEQNNGISRYDRAQN